MKVLINCYDMPLAKEGSGGAGKFVHGIIDGLIKKSELSIICSKHNSEEYEYENVKKLFVLNNYDDLDMSSICEDFDIYFNPANKLMPLNLPKDLPVVTVIHDLQHNYYPHFFSKGAFEARNKEYGYAIARSDGLVAISNWEKRNFEKYFKANHTKVIYHAPYLFERKNKNDYHKIDIKKLTEFDKYYLYPAIPWIHKNHYRLIEAFSILNKTIKNGRFNLILTGSEHSDSTSLLNKKIKELNCEDYIETLGYVSDDELISLMSNAKGMVFPSLYEGFGIPIIDAMNFGLPVIASNLTSIPEITSGAIEYFNNSFDSYSIATDIQNFDRKINQGSYDIDAAKRIGANYSTERLTSELLNYFERIIRLKNNVPLNASFAMETVNLNKESRKITIIVDLDIDDKDEAERFLDKFLSNSDHQIFDYALIIPYKLREQLDYVRFNKITQIATCAYYQENILASKVIALEHLLEICIKTDYLLCVNVEQYFQINYLALRKSISFLDYHPDLYSIIKSEEKYSQVFVKRPIDDEEIRIRKYNESLNNPEKILLRFYDRLISTRICREEGMIGSVAALSKDISFFSNMVF